MSNFPATGYLSDAGRTKGEMKVAMEDQLQATKQIPGSGIAESTLTIAAGAIVPTIGVHSVDTEAAAVSDDLTTITGTNLPDGSMLWLRSVSAARVVTVKHNAGGAGQIALKSAADLALSSPLIWLVLKRTGANWEEVGQLAPPAALVLPDVRCQARMSANQTISNNNPTALALDVEIADTHAMHDTVTNNDRITITAGAGAGRYLVTGTVTWNVSSAAGFRMGSIVHTRGGSAVTVSAQQLPDIVPSTSDYMHLSVTAIVDALVGDYFQLVGSQRSGGNLAVIGGAPGTTFGSDAKTNLCVVKLN